MPLITKKKADLIDELEHGDCQCQRCSGLHIPS